MQITSWQGQGLVVDALEQTGEGEYRTTQPIPIHDDWKALLRIHDGRMLTAVPIYLPADEAIPADEITADDGMTREAIPEIEILQRELKASGGGLWLLANLVVLACTLALIAAISWGVARYSRRAGAREPFPDAAGRRSRTTHGRRRRSAAADPAPRVLVTVRPSRLAAALAGLPLAAGADRAAPAAAAPAPTRVVLGVRRRRPRLARGAAAGQRIEVQVAGGQVSGDTGRVPVAAGDARSRSSSPATSPTRCTCTATTWRPS